jgi:Tol biopolymer transport system component
MLRLTLIATLGVGLLCLILLGSALTVGTQMTLPPLVISLRSRDLRHNGLFLLDAAHGTRLRLDRRPASSFRLSQDQRQIAYAVEFSYPGIASAITILSSNGERTEFDLSHERTRRDFYSQFAFAPDGNHIALMNAGEANIYLLDTRLPNARVECLTCDRVRALDPVFAPDGSRLAFRDVSRNQAVALSLVQGDERDWLLVDSVEGWFTGAPAVSDTVQRMRTIWSVDQRWVVSTDADRTDRLQIISADRQIQYQVNFPNATLGPMVWWQGL